MERKLGTRLTLESASKWSGILVKFRQDYTLIRSSMQELDAPITKYTQASEIEPGANLRRILPATDHHGQK